MAIELERSAALLVFLAAAPTLLAGCPELTTPAPGRPGTWQYVDTKHRVYLTTDPRDTGEDRSQRTSTSTNLNEMRHYTLQFINGLRRMNGRRPLVLDPELNAFAQEGSVELSINHAPHHHFEESAYACSCRPEAETQGYPHGWAPAPVERQISEILSAMLSEGPGGGHHDAMLWPEARRLGVGIVNPGGHMYFTNDFGR